MACQHPDLSVDVRIVNEGIFEHLFWFVDVVDSVMALMGAPDRDAREVVRERQRHGTSRPRSQSLVSASASALQPSRSALERFPSLMLFAENCHALSSSQYLSANPRAIPSMVHPPPQVLGSTGQIQSLRQTDRAPASAHLQAGLTAVHDIFEFRARHRSPYSERRHHRARHIRIPPGDLGWIRAYLSAEKHLGQGTSTPIWTPNRKQRLAEYGSYLSTHYSV